MSHDNSSNGSSDQAKKATMQWSPFYTAVHPPSGIAIRVNKTEDRGRTLFSVIVNRVMTDPKTNTEVYKPFIPIFQAKSEPHVVVFQNNLGEILRELADEVERVMHDALLADVTKRNDMRYEKDVERANRNKPKTKVTGKTEREREKAKPRKPEEAPPKPLGVTVEEEG